MKDLLIEVMDRIDAEMREEGCHLDLCELYQLAMEEISNAA